MADRPELDSPDVRLDSWSDAFCTELVSWEGEDPGKGLSLAETSETGRPHMSQQKKYFPLLPPLTWGGV